MATPRSALPARLAAALACLLQAATAQAGPLADPTRPPNALAPTGQSGPSTLAAGRLAVRAAAAAAPAAEPAAPLPQLQGVQTPVRGPALALVDGRTIQVGDSLAGRTVMAIDAQGITLGGGRHGPLRLLLLAGSPKQPAGSIATASAAQYEAALPAREADAAADAGTPTERPRASTATPATTAPLSVAGRN